MALIEKGAARLGLTCVSAVRADGKINREEWNERFDLVLCDVPSPVRLQAQAREDEGGLLKPRVFGEKSLRDGPVLLRQDGAGGIKERPAGLHVPGGVVQDGPLHRREAREGGGVLVADIRLLADDAEP